MINEKVREYVGLTNMKTKCKDCRNNYSIQTLKTEVMFY